MSLHRFVKVVLTLAFAAVPAGAYAAADGVRSEGVAATAASPLVAGAPVGGPPNFDVRIDSQAAERPAAVREAQRELRDSLGRQGILRVDRETGSPRLVARRNGFLTRQSSKPPAALVVDYVRANAAAFGLDRDDLDDLRLVLSYTTARGLTHLEWHQLYRGVAGFDTLLRANVKDGRLVNVSSTLEPDLAVKSVDPDVSPASAVRRALADVGVHASPRALSQQGRNRSTVLSGGNLAELVLFVDAGRARLAWSLIASADDDAVYRSVVDAVTGDVLRRVNLVSHASVNFFGYYPGASSGGVQQTRVFDPSTQADPWLTGGLDRLRGDNTHTYSDVNDDLGYDCSFGCVALGDPAAADEIPPSSGSGTTSAAWNYAQTVVDPSTSAHDCPSAGCTWDNFLTTSAFSWDVNREQAGTNLFYLVNTFHDHLQSDAGVLFDDASGNFEETSASSSALGGDPVLAQVNDGADTDNIDADPEPDGFPDSDHTNNANMLTLPERELDGTPIPAPFRSPRMQMYLFSSLGFDGTPLEDTNDVNGADDAAIVYHEYTHGLVGRLVDPFGVGLAGDQAGAMNEGWSDWYAMDYLNAVGLQPDNAGPDVALGVYENAPLRTQPIDCPLAPGTPSTTCPGGQTPHFGAYTYGDFGSIAGGPQVHADGEIWSGTLWELRRQLIAARGTATGIFQARALVTDAMRLTVVDPSFLDVRDAILQADEINGFDDCEIIWRTFAARGMGADASTTGSNDTAPNQGFANPSATACGSPPPPPDTDTDTTPDTTPDDSGAADTTPPSKARLARSARADRRGRFSMRITGEAGTRGVIVLTAAIARGTAARSVVVARKSFVIPESGRVTVRLKLKKPGLRVLRRKRALRARARVVLTDGAGLKSSTSRKLRIKLRRRR